MLNRKIIYMCSDNRETLVDEKIKGKLSIVLLKEDGIKIQFIGSVFLCSYIHKSELLVILK